MATTTSSTQSSPSAVTPAEVISRAWLLDFGNHLYAAVGLHEMAEVLISPTLYDVPCTPYFASEAVILRGRILPVIEVASLLEGERMITDEGNVVGIGVFQANFDAPITYGALRLATTPQSINVTDAQACNLPASHRQWRKLAIACFNYDGLAVPVIDFNILFSANVAATIGQR